MRRSTSALTLLLTACESSPSGADFEHIRAAGALGPYSGSVRAGGFVFLSGKIGTTRDQDFQTEVRTTIEAMIAELAQSDLTLADLVSVTVYLTDLDKYAEFNEVYADMIPVLDSAVDAGFRDITFIGEYKQVKKKN